MKLSRIAALIGILFAITLIALFVLKKIYKPQTPVLLVSGFKNCLSAGYETDQGFPRRICKTPDGRAFLESLTDPENSVGLARVISPSSSSNTKFPVTVRGEATADWFVSGGFPVKIIFSDGKIEKVISSGIAYPDGIKNVSGSIPFKAELNGSTVGTDGSYYIALIKNDPEEKLQRSAVVSYVVRLVP